MVEADGAAWEVITASTALVDSWQASMELLCAAPGAEPAQGQSDGNGEQERSKNTLELIRIINLRS